MRVHKDIKHIEEELGLLTHHSTGTYLDKYIDRSSPMITTVLGGLCLVGFHNCHVDHLSSPCINIMTKFCFNEVMNLLIDELIYYNAKHEHKFGRDGSC